MIFVIAFGRRNHITSALVRVVSFGGRISVSRSLPLESTCLGQQFQNLISMKNLYLFIQAGLVGAVLLLATRLAMFVRQVGLTTPLRTNPEPASVAARLVYEQPELIYSNLTLGACG
jgi:hypothetical protein